MAGIIDKLRELRYRYLMSPAVYAKKMGVRFGKDCIIASRNWGSEPYLVELGDHVHVTFGVNFITHDGGVWVFREKIPDFDVFGPIKVGNNVYFGNHATILPGVTIGNNCVIGAYSMVTKSIPDNSVVAGNPARYICTVEAYYTRIATKNMALKGKSADMKKAELLRSLTTGEARFINKNLIK